MYWIEIVMICTAYASGSVISAVLISRIMRLPDPRTHGSGNPGTTNMLRMHGRLLAALTLAGDVLKAALPVLLAKSLQLPPLLIAIVGAAAMVGHLFPIFYGFNGGKGIACFIGILTALNPILGLAYVIIWLLVALLFRYSSLAAIVATSAAPIYSIWLTDSMFYAISYGLIALAIIWRHRRNIHKLINAQETQIKW